MLVAMVLLLLLLLLRPHPQWQLLRMEPALLRMELAQP